MLSYLQVSRPIDMVSPDTIFTVFGFRITNSTMFAVLILVLFALGCFFVIRKFTIQPGKTQAAIELVYEAIEKLILGITASKRETQIILPFIGALLLFIAASNLLGNVPGLTSILVNKKALLRMPTADFSTTLALAVAAILSIQLMSIKDFGLFGHIGKYIKLKALYVGFSKGIKEGLLSVVDFFIGLLDIVGELAKIISISLRLFGNLYAGMVLTTVVFGLLAYVAPAFLLIMGLMFAVVQAVVFSSLVTVFYSLAIKQKPEEDFA